MRVRVKGVVTRSRMHEVAEAISATLEAHGVTEWCGLNVYLTPMEPGTREHVELIGPDGEEIEEMVIANPAAVRKRRRPAEVVRLVS